MEKKTVIP